ncbi:exported protein [Dyella lipolytica]|uniref:Uncharacterized protein n=1 Tax=Dyella lipolytica TaxID=1867835 RepID=A0ABW8J2T7_9GAMM|nr:TorF family putative porin [Dyella lipolytica]GLQ45337.1 exported protein [Dyella lipolytica]
MAVALTLFVMQARAQVTGSATLVSDYRFRGVSLSDDRPSAQLAFDYDLPASGWYAGGVMSTVRLDPTQAAQLLGYAGFAQRLLPDLSWEAGVRYTGFTGHESYAYAETYVGLTYKQLVGRVYYAPDYFNAGYPALYAELNDSHTLSGPWYVFGHVGYLRRGGDVADDHVSRFRSDIRMGVGLALAPCDMQLSWSTVYGANNYVFGYPASAGVTRNAWIVSISYAW